VALLPERTPSQRHDFLCREQSFEASYSVLFFDPHSCDDGTNGIPEAWDDCCTGDDFGGSIAECDLGNFGDEAGFADIEDDAVDFLGGSIGVLYLLVNADALSPMLF